MVDFAQMEPLCRKQPTPGSRVGGTHRKMSNRGPFGQALVFELDFEDQGDAWGVENGVKRALKPVQTVERAADRLKEISI